MSYDDLLTYGMVGTNPGTPLRAGPLEVMFHHGTCSLRHIRLGDREVLQEIFVAVRDRNWGTILPRIEDLQLENGPDSFRIAFNAQCRERDIDYSWKGAIDGKGDGTIEFRFDGEARSSFLKNRIGICVLHPSEGCAGEPCEVEHTGGAIEQGAFPRLIGPHQPFKSIRAIRHRIGPDLQAEVRFAGEVFEMEDQRNWTDASFKTYSTPLELPFPVQVEPGDRASQSVTLSLVGSRPTPPPRRAGGSPCRVTVPLGPSLDRPPVGLQIARRQEPLSPGDCARLRLLGLDHLRAEIHFKDPKWPADLERARRESKMSGIDLHLALFLTDEGEEELEAIFGELESERNGVSLLLLYQEGEEVAAEKFTRLAAERIAAFSPRIALAAGTDGDFAELNRDRPAADSPAHPSWSMSPQVHAFDTATMVETLRGQPDAVETARTFSAKPAVISPITLRPRSRPDGSDVALDASEFPRDQDPRQCSLFCASWTLASIARLGATGWIHSLTYYETTGGRGVMEREGAPSLIGGVFPVFHVLADLEGFDHMAPAPSSEPLRIEAVALFDRKGRRRVLAANLAGDEHIVRIETGAKRARIRILDARNVEEAVRRPEAFRSSPGEPQESASGVFELRLGSFSAARLDLES